MEIKDFLTNNYQVLRQYYRLGLFKNEIPVCSLKDFTARNFQYDTFCFITEKKAVKNHSISFREAVEQFYEQIIQHKEKPEISLPAINTIEFEIIVYECLDVYLLSQPDLAKIFIEHSKDIYKILGSNTSKLDTEGLIKRVETLFGVKKRKDLGHAVKIYLLAGLCGISALYRTHNDDNYALALKYAETFKFFIKNILPTVSIAGSRESFGLFGLVCFLTGQLLRATAHLEKAEKSFLDGINAYTEKIIQYEPQFPQGKHRIKDDGYEEVKTLNLRRAALVSTLGLTYLYLVSSQLTKAFSSITLARATLRQNNTGIYNTYSDLLFYALRRAKYSDNRAEIDKVIAGIKNCIQEFRETAQAETTYEHRANLELAIAYKYLADFFEDDDNKLKFYNEAVICLNKVFKFAKNSNNHLYCEALVISSHIQRVKPFPDLRRAENDAAEAAKELKETSLTYIEALLALGSVYSDKAKQNNQRSEDYFEKARQELFKALEVNKLENNRITGICYLKIAKLFSQRAKYTSQTYFYLNLWKEMSHLVEHEFCQGFARKFERELMPVGDIFVVTRPLNLSYLPFETKLKIHLAKIAVEKLVKNHLAGTNIIDINSDSKIKTAIINVIEKEMGKGSHPKAIVASSSELNLVEYFKQLVGLI